MPHEAAIHAIIKFQNGMDVTMEAADAGVVQYVAIIPKTVLRV